MITININTFIFGFITCIILELMAIIVLGFYKTYKNKK